MRLVRGLHNLKATKTGCVVALGGFDAMHIGHLAVIRQAQRVAEEYKLEAVVVFFEPLPREFLFPEQIHSRIYSFAERTRLLQSFGVRKAISLRFDEGLKNLTAQAFVRETLVNKIHARHVVVGEGFRFGSVRQGTLETMRSLGKSLGLSVSAVSAVFCQGGAVSSTRIRRAVRSGDFLLAEQLLGRPYAISARVTRGDQRGAELGFPTANLMTGSRPRPLHGVYAAWVTGAGTTALGGVLNAGCRPTFNGNRYVVEIHITDYSANLYGRRLGVEMVAKIRDERRFASIKALRAQISEDVHSARQHLLS